MAKQPEIDIALTEGEDGHPLAHRLDCPMVEDHRRRGLMIASLFGIDGPLPPFVKQHDCLKKKAPLGAAQEKRNGA